METRLHCVLGIWEKKTVTIGDDVYLKTIIIQTGSGERFELTLQAEAAEFLTIIKA